MKIDNFQLNPTGGTNHSARIRFELWNSQDVSFSLACTSIIIASYASWKLGINNMHIFNERYLISGEVHSWNTLKKLFCPVIMRHLDYFIIYLRSSICLSNVTIYTKRRSYNQCNNWNGTWTGFFSSIGLGYLFNIDQLRYYGTGDVRIM